MKYGITLLGNRVSPRCTHADSILFVSQRKNEIATKKRIPVNTRSLEELCDLLVQNRVDTLICGGITDGCKELLHARNLIIVDNVIGTTDKVLQALESGKLEEGFGFTETDSESCLVTENKPGLHGRAGYHETADEPDREKSESFDCLKCDNRVCFDGKICDKSIGEIDRTVAPSSELRHMLEAATDISREKERTLCRLSELIYFCLEMQYTRLGVAYCVDLEEPANILVSVLRRFFTVYPVCCKIGGHTEIDPLQTEKKQGQRKTVKEIACNPWGQAQILNRLETDLNVMVGLCMGADCVFIQGSLAPATGLFIKDKSLANNPIGAIYSEYYLKEATRMRS